ncbi:MAG: hypothetical protein M3228_05425 [Actinomycetota bacterium]|nr:hypothetical protein [Actinomycetota bacterium]
MVAVQKDGKSLTGVKAIEGGYHCLALMENGAVLALGTNTYGTLGDGTTTNRTTPVAVKKDGAHPGRFTRRRSYRTGCLLDAHNRCGCCCMAVPVPFVGLFRPDV